MGGGPVFNFTTGEEVDRTVAALPQVTDGLNRYRAGDAETTRDEDGDPATATNSFAGSTTGESGGPAPLARPESDAANPAPESEHDNSAVPPAGSATERAVTGRFTDDAGADCLARVAGTQTYPMVPLLAREASFQGRAAWLLVFAWSPEDSGRAALDQWQSWLVDPTDCRALAATNSPARALYRLVLEPFLNPEARLGFLTFSQHSP